MSELHFFICRKHRNVQRTESLYESVALIFSGSDEDTGLAVYPSFPVLLSLCFIVVVSLKSSCQPSLSKGNLTALGKNLLMLEEP